MSIELILGLIGGVSTVVGLQFAILQKNGEYVQRLTTIETQLNHLIGHSSHLEQVVEHLDTRIDLLNDRVSVMETRINYIFPSIPIHANKE